MEWGLVRVDSSWIKPWFGGYRFEKKINMDFTCTYRHEFNYFFFKLKLGEFKTKWDMEELHNGVS